MDGAKSSSLPELAADLTWVHVNGGDAYSVVADWDNDGDPQVGQHVTVSNGGPFMEAVITALEDDGVIRLKVSSPDARRA